MRNVVPKNEKSNESIENKLNSIENIITQLESGELSLEQSLALFTEGSTLIGDCRTILDSTAKKIAAMAESNDAE